MMRKKKNILKTWFWPVFLTCMAGMYFYPKEAEKAFEKAAGTVKYAARSAYRAADAFRPDFIPYEDFKPGDERKFLPFSCRKHSNAINAGDFNEDGKKDFAMLCRLSGKDRTTSQYYDNLFVALSGKDSYRSMHFDMASDMDFKVVSVGEKDEFLAYSRQKEEILFLDSAESTSKRTAHVLRCSDETCTIEDEDLSSYIDRLCQAGEMDAIKQFWNGQHFEKLHAADSIRRIRPPEAMGFLSEEYNVRHDSQAMRLLGEFKGFLAMQDILSMYRSGSDASLLSMEKLAKSPNDRIILTDFCSRIIEDEDNYYHARPSFFNARQEKLRQHMSCQHKRVAVDVLSRIKHPYADGMKRALVGHAYEHTIPECIRGYVINELGGR